MKMSRDGQKSNHVLQIMKFLKDVLASDKKTYSEKVTILVMTWERIASSGRRQRPLAAMCIVEVMFKDTLNILLHGDWPKLSPVNKTHLIQMLSKYKQDLCKGMLWLESKINKLIELVNDPWTLPSLERILHNNPSPATDEQIMEFCVSERGLLLVTRLEMLCSNRCEKVAIKLAEACFQALNISNSQLKSLFSNFEFNFIFDIYLCLLYKYKRVESIINLLKPFSLKEGYNTVLRLKKRSYVCKQKVWKLSSKVAEVVTRYFITVCMMSRIDNILIFKNFIREWLTFYNSTDMDSSLEHEVRKLLQTAEVSQHIYCIAEGVVEMSNTRNTQAFRSLIMELYIRAVTSDINYLERVKLLADREEQTLCEKRLAEKFLALADLVKDHAGVRREFVLTAFSIHPSHEIYQRVEEEAIATGKALPQTNISRQENLEMGALSEGLSSLSSEEPDVKDSTLDSMNNDSQDSGAYTEIPNRCSLHLPYDGIGPEGELCFQCGDFTGIQTPSSPDIKSEVKKERTLDALILIKGNIVTESLNYDVLAAPSHQVLEAEKLGLSSQVCADLVTLLGSNRYQMLTWVLEWSELSTRCQRYIEEADSIKSDNKELKFLEIDYNKYKDWPENEDEYDCIEKGYEQWLEDESESEDYRRSDEKNSNTSDSEASMIKAAIRRSKKHTGRYAESSTDSDGSLYRRRTAQRNRRSTKRNTKCNSDSDSVSGSLGSDGQKTKRTSDKSVKPPGNRKRIIGGRLINVTKSSRGRKKLNLDVKAEIVNPTKIGLPTATHNDPNILKSLRAFRPNARKIKHKDMFKTMTKSALNAKISKVLKSGIQNFNDCYVDLSKFRFDVKDFEKFYKTKNDKGLPFDEGYMTSLKNELISPSNIPRISNNATVNVVHIEETNNIARSEANVESTAESQTSSDTIVTTNSISTSERPDVIYSYKNKAVTCENNSQATSVKSKPSTSQIQSDTNVVYKMSSTQRTQSSSPATFSDIQQAVNYYKNSCVPQTTSSPSPSSNNNNNDCQIVTSTSATRLNIQPSFTTSNSFTLQTGARTTQSFSIIGSINMSASSDSTSVVRRGLVNNNNLITSEVTSQNKPSGIEQLLSASQLTQVTQSSNYLSRNIIHHQASDNNNTQQVLTVSSQSVPNAPVRFYTPTNTSRNILMLDHNVRGILNPLQVRNTKPNQTETSAAPTFKVIPASNASVFAQRNLLKASVVSGRTDTSSPSSTKINSSSSSTVVNVNKTLPVDETGSRSTARNTPTSFIRLEPVLRQTSSPKLSSLSPQTTYIPTVLMRAGGLATSASTGHSHLVTSRSSQVMVANKHGSNSNPSIFVTQNASSNTIHYTVANENSTVAQCSVIDQGRSEVGKQQQQQHYSVVSQGQNVGLSQVIKQSASTKHDVINLNTDISVPALVNISNSNLSTGNVESLLLVTSHTSLNQPILTFTNANNVSKQYFPITQETLVDHKSHPQSHVIVQLPSTQTKSSTNIIESIDQASKKIESRNRVKNKILIVKNENESWIPANICDRSKMNEKPKDQSLIVGTTKRLSIEENEDGPNKRKKVYHDVSMPSDDVINVEASENFLVQKSYEDSQVEEYSSNVTNTPNETREKVYIIVQEPSFQLMKTSSLPKFNQVFRKSYQVKHKSDDEGEKSDSNSRDNLPPSVKCDKIVVANNNNVSAQQTDSSKNSNFYFRTKPNQSGSRLNEKQIETQVKQPVQNDSSPVYSIENVGVVTNTSTSSNLNKQRVQKTTLIQNLPHKLTLNPVNTQSNVSTNSKVVKTQETVPAPTLIYAAARPQGQIVIGRVNNPSLGQGSSVVYTQPTSETNQQPQALLLTTVPQRSRTVVPGTQFVRLPNSSGVWRMASAGNTSKILQIAQVARPQNLVVQSSQDPGLLMPSNQPVFLHHVTSLPVKPVGVTNTNIVSETKCESSVDGDNIIHSKKVENLENKQNLVILDNENSCSGQEHSSPSIVTPELETVALLKDIKEFENVFEETKLKFEMEEQQSVNVIDSDPVSEVKNVLDSEKTSTPVCLTSAHQTVLVQPQLMLHKPHMIITSPATHQIFTNQRVDKHIVDKDVEKRLLITSKPKNVDESQPGSHLTVAYVSHTTPTSATQQQTQKQKPLVVVTSYGQAPASPAASITSQSSSSPNSITAASSLSGSVKSSSNKSKVRSIKTVPNPAKSPPVAKPQQKPQEDASTTQKIFAILQEYAEQLRNSPDVNNRPAPRRRSNPPTNSNPKRKKSLCKNKETFSDGDEASFSEDVTENLQSSEDSSSGVAVLQVCVSSSQ